MVQITNSKERYGLLMKLFHWVVILVFLLQYYLVYRREYFIKGSPEKLQYILLHKSFGLTMIFLALLFILWRIINVKPSYPEAMQAWEKKLAKITQYLLYLVIITMPISGFLMSEFSGKQIWWFAWRVPVITPINKDIGGLFYNIHTITSKAALGLIGLHVLGALKHALTQGNHLVRRMLSLKS